MNQKYDADSEQSYAVIQTYVYIETKRAKTAKGEGIPSKVRPSLEDANSFCNATVHINFVPPQPHLQTDSTPRLNIKAIKVAEESSTPLQITFEISADGTSPIAIPKHDLRLLMFNKDNVCLAPSISFPEAATDYFTVKPDDPITLTAYVPLEYLPENKIIPGEYKIQIALDAGKGSDQHIDYQWDHRIISTNRFISESHDVTIK